MPVRSKRRPFVGVDRKWTHTVKNNETDASDEAQGVTLDDAKTGAGLRSRRLTALRDKSELLGVLHLFDGHHYRVALGWVMVISEMQIYAVRYHG
jgi:hypothetical protein